MAYFKEKESAAVIFIKLWVKLCLKYFRKCRFVSSKQKSEQGNIRTRWYICKNHVMKINNQFHLSGIKKQQQQQNSGA